MNIFKDNAGIYVNLDAYDYFTVERKREGEYAGKFVVLAIRTVLNSQDKEHDIEFELAICESGNEAWTFLEDLFPDPLTVQIPSLY